MSADGRFAPSPTGRLHLGNLRTALAAWLWSRSGNGRFLLRIDDLDPDRSRIEHEQVQLDDLRRIGLDWDGPPVRQSARLDRYRDVLDQLARDERTYPCFCSRAEVRAAASAAHGDDAPDGSYPGTCARLAPSVARARVLAGEPHALRIRAGNVRHGYDDELLGRVAGHVEDFVVQRRDGVPAYNLASIVDEADLQVGLVVRGADLAPGTVWQHWLGVQLGLPELPRFAHVPLVLGPDGVRLAKRHGAVGLDELAAAGVAPDRVVGWLAASLGLTRELHAGVRPAELVESFDPDLLPTRPTVVDPAALWQ